MRKEQSVFSSRKAAFARPVLRSREEALAELRRPCGRFKPIESTEEKLRAFIAEKIGNLELLGNPLYINDGTPLNWQRLLAFLHENNVTSMPRFNIRSQRNDYPHLLEFFELDPKTSADATDGREVLYAGFGGSLGREEAMSKAVGEVLERYFLSTYKRDALHASSYEHLARYAAALDVTQFDFFLGWQKKRFPNLAFDESSVFSWVEGTEFSTDRPIFIPAQLVYWNYHFAPGGASREKMIFMQTTSGSAGHVARDEAILAALLEAIQRDAFLIYWLNNLSPKVIDNTTIESPVIQSILGTLRAAGFETIFLNTTSDFNIPTATCVVIDKSDPTTPIFSIGSSAGFTIEETLFSSLVEAYVVNHYVSLSDQYVLPENYEPFTSTNIMRFERLHAWRGPIMAERIKFFLSGKKQSAQEFIGTAPTIDTVAKRLAHVVGECASRGKGYEIYTYEVRHPVLDTLGYHVIRTIVPELIPLYLVEFAAPLNAKRLREVPGKIGYKAAEKFNPWPHPFP